MCGIAGVATADDLALDDAAHLDAMLQSLAHRGPDDQYAMGDSRAVLGARRLSIIDIDGGRQPLTDESGRIIAVQNGEVYNYVELRSLLRQRGHMFRTEGDTEVIVHLYEEYGLDFVTYLRGMFAIAIWDGNDQRLILARDRLGKKPLYWRTDGRRLVFGSELKALMTDPALERAVDDDALRLYLAFDYVPAPRTILRGVSKLPPASVLVWDGGVPRIQRYWSAPGLRRTSSSFEDDVEQGASLFEEAVRLRLRADVPVGVFLSGGMDSSLVTATMVELSDRPVRTFSIGFEEAEFDELPYARAVAQKFGTDHTEDIVKLDAVALLPQIARSFDEPLADPSVLPTFRVAQLAAKHLKVVLTGDGGDELFGGYGRYRSMMRLAKLDRAPARLLQVVARLARKSMPKGRAGSPLDRRLELTEHMAPLTQDERYVQMMMTADSSLRARLVGHGSDVSAAYLHDALRGPHVGLERILRADMKTYLPEGLLVKMDRATMANSIEARSPFLDHEFVEFATALPEDRKISAAGTKALLRAIAGRQLPAEIVDRPKQGFGIPVDAWFRAELGTQFESIALAPDAALRDYVDVDVASKILTNHRAEAADSGDVLWSLLTFELWAREWLPRLATRDVAACAAEPGPGR